MTSINWAVAGVGDVAVRRVIPAILSEPRSSLYGVITRNPAKAQAWPGIRAWQTLDEALQDPLLDVLYIALPVSMHAEAAIAALRAGKHVLCEKPMSMNAAQAHQMVGAATAAKGLFGVAYYRRHFPKLIRAKQLIAEGAIGQPLLVEANSHGWLESEERAWLRHPALSGGGPLYDTGCHRIDAMNFLFGQPTAACGMLSNALHDLAVEDCATAVIKYSHGSHGVIDVRWNSRVSRDQFRVIGTGGAIVLDPLNGPELRIAGRVEMLPAHPNVHYPLIENFVDAVLANSPDRLTCNAEQACWVDWVMEQVIRSQLPG